jgi:hypothetical protein
MTTTDDYRDGDPIDADADGDSDDDSGPTEVYHYDRDTTEPCSQVVVHAVAEALGRSPLDLEPLYYCIDPDALDDLVDRSFGSGPAHGTTVRFDFAGCRVAVSSVDVLVIADVDERSVTRD